MKPKLIDRILLAIVLLVVIAIMLCVLLITLGVVNLSVLQQMVSSLSTWEAPAMIVVGACLLLLIFAIRLLFFMFPSEGRSSMPQQSAVLIKSSDAGSAFISLTAIDAMAMRFIKTKKEVRDCATQVLSNEAGVNINVRFALMPDTNIPEFTDGLVHELKESIEKQSGIIVTNVSLMVVPGQAQQASQQMAVK